MFGNFINLDWLYKELHFLTFFKNSSENMGADGGFRITRISDIKNKWNELREILIREAGQELNQSKNYEIKVNAELYDYCKRLPKKLSGRITNNELLKLFEPYKSCDCPFIMDDLMFTGEGDYVADEMRQLSGALDFFGSTPVETWT